MHMAVGTVIIAVLWWVAGLVGYIYYTSRSKGLSNVAPALQFHSFFFSFFFLFMLRVLRSGEKKNYIPVLKNIIYISHKHLVFTPIRSTCLCCERRTSWNEHTRYCLHNWGIKCHKNSFSFFIFWVLYLLIFFLLTIIWFGYGNCNCTRVTSFFTKDFLTYAWHH